ncbi:DUF3800 domain-containing protein [Roseicella frigidaeris]|uniref:DUF3800 domain-containing protein n=1 Tax=Roseicella frigidaeris TaxID=2230885 RepID=A0A327M8R2_9PROT|nr:DUF3800 domain-containing protein [Roseicella frigidaeris]RAI58746.1 hypothetical protein DOO78_11730 [Roseicella frigidaeris]
MTHSFIAYIDESGDDGLGNYRVPGGGGGASHWFTLSATVVRASRDLETVQWRDEIAARLNRRNGRRDLHFTDLNHGQRTVAAQILSGKPMRIICVVANKTIIPQGIYNEKINCTFIYADI